MDFLERYQFRCLTAERWDDALRMVGRENPDAIILDQWMGDVDTLPNLPQLRGLTEAPVLILTSNQEVSDRVVGLELGADDFLCKPVSGRELVARVRAHLRGRQRPSPGGGAPRGGWEIDRQAHRLRRPGGRLVHLTTAEFTLMALLMDKAGETHSRDDLTRAVFNRAWRAGDRAVDTLVANLRDKLDTSEGTDKAATGTCIVTIRNAGYKFVNLPE